MILARNIIALARINDVTGTTYYYKSQVSTAAKPAKPTAATPSGWSTTEPAYNAANSVYVTVKTTYSDNSFSYSDVSLASAYEGAKEAHNTAASAKSTAEAAQEAVEEYINPVASKSYTGVYCTANADPAGYLYFGQIKPRDYYAPWRVTYRIHAKINGISDGYQYSEVIINGNKNTYYSYAAWNTTNNTSYRPMYYHLLYTLRSAGVTAGLGHLMGIGFRYAYNPNKSANARDIDIEVTEADNCDINLFDSMILYANAPGTGDTNYYSRYTLDATTQGRTETGDRNETNHILNNFCGKTGVLGIWRYALFMRDGAGTYQNICTAADGTITSTTAATKKPNPNGFEPGSALYYSSGSGYGANANISSSVYASYGAFDSRYSLNTTLTAGSLTTYKNVYLVGTISQEDGLFYLDEVWWTQTPDTKGKIYILVGSCYDSTTSNCRISLYEQNTWYIHDGTGLTPYNDALSQKAQDTANGAQEAVDQAAESIAELSDNLDEQISDIQSSISDLEDGLERQAESVANQIAEVDRANDEIRSSINSVDATYANAFSQLYQYIRFITDPNGAFQGVELGPLNGEDEERLQLRVGTFRDDKNQLINCISFSKGDENLGYWDGQNLYTGNIIVKVTQRAQFGNFAWVPRATGSLSFMKVV